MRGYVYILTCLFNGKYYIGQTCDMRRRMWAHSRSKAQLPIACAIRAYGWDNFTWDILGIAEVGPELDALERLWILLSNSVESSVGYNLRMGGDTATFNKETRKRMSDIQKLNPQRYWLGKRRPDTSERNKARIGYKNPRAKCNQPKVQKARKDYSGTKNAFFGKSHSEDMRKIISERAKEGIAKISNTQEFREKQRQASLSRWAKVRALETA